MYELTYQLFRTKCLLLQINPLWLEYLDAEDRDNRELLYCIDTHELFGEAVEFASERVQDFFRNVVGVT